MGTRFEKKEISKTSYRRYHVGALLKISLGVIVGLLLYFFINPQQDPIVAISLILLSVFLVGRGTSFYGFWLINLVAKRTTDEIVSDSYKMSLLFGFFVIINSALIFMQAWSKLL
jgi:hypothetical protein